MAVRPEELIKLLTEEELRAIDELEKTADRQLSGIVWHGDTTLTICLYVPARLLKEFKNRYLRMGWSDVSYHNGQVSFTR